MSAFTCFESAAKGSCKTVASIVLVRLNMIVRKDPLSVRLLFSTWALMSFHVNKRIAPKAQTPHVQEAASINWGSISSSASLEYEPYLFGSIPCPQHPKYLRNEILGSKTLFVEVF